MEMNLVEMDQVEIINGRKIVKKHVAAVHSSNNLSLLERKIANVLLYVSFPKLKKEKYHYITIAKLKSLLSFNSKNTKVLKEAIQSLQRTTIELNLLNDKVSTEGLEEGLFSIQLLGLFQVVEAGTIKYSYPEELIDLLSNPAIYAKINLPVQAKFRSSYSLALYENCVRFRGLPYTKDFDIKTFRKLMGVEEGKYEIFRDFNRRVLTPAVTEINRCSDIRITPDITRVGRRVRSIKFVLGERPIKKRIGQVKVKSSRFSKRCIALGDLFGVKHDILETLIQKYGEERVEQAAEYVKNTPAYNKGGIPNLGGYFISAIKEAYQITQKEVKTDDINNAKGKGGEPRNIEVDAGRHKKALSIFQSLDSLLQKKIEIEYLKSCDPMSRMYYDKFGIESILVFETGMSEFLLRNYSGYIECK
jgi:plasmid replication initiation protein